MKTLPTWLAVCITVFFLWQNTASASQQVQLTIGSWGFDDISAQNLDIDLTLTAKGFVIDVSAESVVLAQPIGQLKKIKLHCDELVFLSGKTTCTKGSLAFLHKDLGSQRIDFSLKKMSDDHYQIAISNFKLANANIAINADYDNQRWQASIESPKALLADIVKFSLPYLPEKQITILSEWTMDSSLAIKANLNGYKQTLERIDLDLQAVALNLSDNQGKYVTENVSTHIQLEAKQQKQTWQWQTHLSVDNGQAYAEPVFVDFKEAAMSIKANGEWQNTTGQLVVGDAMINHDKIVEIQASYSGTLQDIQQLDIAIKQADIAKLYSIWLQPFSLGTAVDKLEIAGQLGLNFKQLDDNYQLSVDLDNVFVDDEKKHFGIYDLSGTIDWTNDNVKTESQLAWQGGYLYAVPFGLSQIKIESRSSSLTLAEPWVLPILDGNLHVNEFSLQRPDGDKTQWTFDGLLTPISMEALSASLGWPMLHGKLSGIIPDVSYANQQVKVDGALMVKLFEGTTIISDLRLNKPFGSLPQLYANVDLTGLDLEILTETFDFGKITGKLDGHVTNLRLSNWQPVQFDASFATPEGDKSRRRISQKAIDNLSQIGGGIGGVLSRSFLRFFEDFSYQKLGLNCKLRNETCEMSGVAEAKQGYYIVKGGGMPPRIDVVGYTRRVDWPDLIERLKAVSKSSGPVIQ